MRGQYVAFFDQISIRDIAQFGGKNASLGSMVRDLVPRGIRVPFGFAISAAGYRHHLRYNNLVPAMQAVLDRFQAFGELDLEQLGVASGELRELVISKPLPGDLADEIVQAYVELSRRYSADGWCDVAVRSSATAEDLPGASFAGQQETFLHVQSPEDLLQSCLLCCASLFTERAMAYRREKKMGDLDVAMSVGVQKMVRSDKACSGVIFTLDTETGFPDVVTITAGYGLGEAVVQGLVNPDEFVVQKPLLKKGFKSLLRKVLGSKSYKLVYGAPPGEREQSWRNVPIQLSGFKSVDLAMHPPFALQEVEVTPEEQQVFCLTDDEVYALANQAMVIEDYYSHLNGDWTPMDIEWAKDGFDHALYIVQARPETVHSVEEKQNTIVRYAFTQPLAANAMLVSGQAVGYGVVTGTVRVIADPTQVGAFRPGDILVTDMTDPDWTPLLRRAGGLVTNRGGRTCHAAIISRELGIPAVIGTKQATTALVDGTTVTLDCSTGIRGAVYAGACPFTVEKFALDTLPHAPVPVYVNIGDPETVFRVALLPVDGVGLARLEFIIASLIGVHPMACARPELVTDEYVREQIQQKLRAKPEDWKAVFVRELAEAMGTIAGAFYPRPVTIRCSDFKSNEYRGLLGGRFFEGLEENPMLGFRGAARYFSDAYAPAFVLECEAIHYARTQMGLDNIKLLVPFVRSVDGARRVVEFLAAHNLRRGEQGLEVLMMVETPENVLTLDLFAPYFDGFSIGSNDLTQLTLGVDRDSAIVQHLFDEQSPGVVMLVSMAIQKARAMGKPIGICGQAPSDFPDFARMLIEAGITSVSMTPDSVIPFLLKFS